MIADFIIVMTYLFVIAMFAAVLVYFWNREKNDEELAKGPPDEGQP